MFKGTNQSNIAILAFVIGVAFIIFQIYILISPQQPLFERPIHISFALVLLFLYKPLTYSKLPKWFKVTIDTLLILASIAISIYYLADYFRLTTRMENVDPVLPIDIVMGIIFVLLLLEGSRRAVGMILVYVLLVFIAYSFWGNILPGWLNFRGFSLPEAIEITTMTTAGVLGITASTSVSFIFYFILFGAFFGAVGGGQLFIDLAIRAAGRATGGTAKAAILGSSLMGSISGSAVANVVSTGVFTIPLMKRSGIPDYEAAGIEAISSTGGQLMPPVMGVAAFVMAEMLGVPYASLALSALVPAIAFYLALLLVVDLRARRLKTHPMTKEEIANTPAILPRIHLLIPPILLIVMLIAGYSAAYAAMAASLVSLLVPFLRKTTWIGFKELKDALFDAPKQAADVAVPIAAIGIVIAVAVQSNLALKFASSLVNLSDGSIYLSLALAMLGCIVMGMGLPTVAAYIIGVVLFVPAIQKLGVEPLAAHFFIFYYCVLSMVTPPVALASFAAAAVGRASTVKTSISAFGFSLVAFFVPFSFIFDMGILWQGTALNIILSSLGLLISTALWAIAYGGWCREPLATPMRILIGLTGLVAVLAPAGSIYSIISLIIGWGLIILLIFFGRNFTKIMPRFIFTT